MSSPLSQEDRERLREIVFRLENGMKLDKLDAAFLRRLADSTEQVEGRIFYDHIVYRLTCLLNGRERPTLEQIRDEFQALRDGTGPSLTDIVAEGRCEECGTLKGLWHKIGCSLAALDTEDPRTCGCSHPEEVCDTCQGITGDEKDREDSDTSPCETCGGTEEFEDRTESAAGPRIDVYPCPGCEDCKGTGEDIEAELIGDLPLPPCPTCCKGSEEEEVTVRLSGDERKALRHEFAEPYGRDIRIGIIGKLRAALADQPSEMARRADPNRGCWTTQPKAGEE